MAEKAVWQPDPEFVKATRLFQWMTALGFSDYDDFLKASTDDIAWFWEEAEKALGISWYKRYSQTLNLDKGIKWPKWFSGGRLNAVCSAVEKWSRQPDAAERTALIWESEDGKQNGSPILLYIKKSPVRQQALKNKAYQKGMSLRFTCR